MTSSSDEVLAYFDRTAVDFDTIYRSQRSTIRRLRDRARRTVTKRLEWVVAFATEHACESVLDVGCGSGRFGLALAANGVRTHGVDFAPQMISLADELAQKANVQGLATFECIDFNEWAQGSEERFDLVIAMGVLDYVEDPAQLLQTATAICQGYIAASFPRLVHPLVPIRVIKFRVGRCPLFLYTRRRVDEIARSAGLKEYTIERFGRDYLLCARGLAIDP